MFTRFRGMLEGNRRSTSYVGAVLACLTMLTGLALAAGPATRPVAGAEPTSPQAAPAKHIKLLAVGNSFSGNASRFLKDIVAASGNELTFGHASIGGCPLSKHWAIAQAFEAKPDDAANRPYTGVKPKTKASLKEMLEAEKWDFVTFQQASIQSFEVENYRPFAANLVAYARKHAPSAEVVFHETWAYRADDSLFKKGDMTQAKMYEGLRSAYAAVAGENKTRIIPVGDAFERARRDPQWQFVWPDPKFDYANPVYPALPDQTHSLNAGYSWSRPGDNGKPTLKMDGHHANVAGQYLGGAVWFEFLYGQSVIGNSFVPPGLNKEQVAFLQKIAHAAVAEPYCVPGKIK